MRKLDKSEAQILATHYYNWQKELEEKGEAHPKYTSSSGKYGKEHYLDIVMSLFYLQKGLCAYTEQLLCAKDLWKKENWKDGKYQKMKPEKCGQLEHFDESLKSKKKDDTGKKDWLLSNFFMVHSDTNTTVKGTKSVEKDENGNYILKSDEAEYNEFELLEYDIDKNIFVANRNLSKEKAEKVDRMLRILGINHATVVEKREREFFVLENLMDLPQYNWNNLPIKEFPTAIEMYKRKVINKENSDENKFSNYLNKVKN